MKLVLKLLTTLAIAGSLTGCATLFGDNDHTVNVNSDPQGAKVYVNNQYMGDTPTKVVLTSLWSPTMIQVKKPGYDPITTNIAPKFQPVGIMNILFWPGFLIDAISGDMMRIPADQRNITTTFPSHYHRG